MPPSSDTTTHTDDTAEADVVLPAHLHARPAGRLAKAAGQLSCRLEISHEGKTVDAAGILAVMGLGATAGTTITVRAHGEGAHAAVTEICELLRTID
ncbi:HPr family phosphocarrier protein [Lentzea nigeriaca]|uniref:HPr family phosphocarrier protein n=1 Tax=Lentzea nigeriaca TaxID=1128665 RepID=UPI00195B7F1A|nr:HPr family phosphocarrier protein [Lentzea nigeriaca]MBM7860681.1 phosphotransferase system HPr (HPr) family protein [Lentzea nigeriaca]